MKFSLVQNELWIDPATPLATIEELKLQKKNERSAMFMAGYIESDILLLLEYPECFIRSWARIRDLFKELNNEDTTILYGQLMRLRPSADRSNQSLIMEFETIISKLRERGQPIEEKLQVMYLLGSLSSDPLYSEVSRIAKWHNPQELPFKKVRTIVLDTYYQLQLQQEREKSGHIASEPSTSGNMTLSNHANHKRVDRKQPAAGKKRRVKCTSCNRFNHSVEQCWRKNPAAKSTSDVQDEPYTNFANAYNAAPIRSRLGKPVQNRIAIASESRFKQPSRDNDVHMNVEDSDVEFDME